RRGRENELGEDRPYVLLDAGYGEMHVFGDRMIGSSLREAGEDVSFALAQARASPVDGGGGQPRAESSGGGGRSLVFASLRRARPWATAGRASSCRITSGSSAVPPSATRRAALMNSSVQTMRSFTRWPPSLGFSRGVSR